MIYKNTEILNFEEVKTVEGRVGVLLQRIPEKIRLQLRPESQSVYKKAACGEIRFVSDFKPVKITLASYEGDSKVMLYFGDFQAGEYIITKEPIEINIEIPNPKFISREDFDDSLYPFSVTVCRLIISGNEIHLIDIEGETIRPPKANEVPKLKYLAYGTSITQGINATSSDLTYVKQVAWRLGTDVINLGAMGSAYCEKEIADYIATRKDWDFATFCISINMLNQGVSAESFFDAAEYFICTVAKSNPTKPIICISLFTAFPDLGYIWPDRKPKATSNEYRNILKRIVDSSKLSNLYYVDGSHLLKSHYGLSHDLLHPSNNGMIEIGENLSNFIKPLLKKI
jgi:lysophospholipase L1-like esterase